MAQSDRRRQFFLDPPVAPFKFLFFKIFAFFFSLFYLRRLFCVYKQGFAALAAGAPYVPQGKGAASAIPDSPNSPKLWAAMELNHAPLLYPPAKAVVGETGIEPVTFVLSGRRSTTEPLTLYRRRAGQRSVLPMN